MGNEVAEFQRIKSQVDSLQKRISKAEGALEQQLETLEREHECSDLPSAKKKLKQLLLESQKASEEFEEAKDAFEKEWGDKLEKDG